jgi:hypothetical protein
MFGPLPLIAPLVTVRREDGGLVGIAHRCGSLGGAFGPVGVELAWLVALVPGLGAESATR